MNWLYNSAFKNVWKSFGFKGNVCKDLLLTKSDDLEQYRKAKSKDGPRSKILLKAKRLSVTGEAEQGFLITMCIHD